MNAHKKRQSRIKYYWGVWLCFVAALFLFRFFPVWDFDGEQLFSLFWLYALPVWLTLGGIGCYEYYQIIGYLKINHHEKWEEITTVPIFGSGNHNNFRTLSFVFSKDDLGDDNVQILKKTQRKLLTLILTVFFTFPVIWILIFL